MSAQQYAAAYAALHDTHRALVWLEAHEDDSTRADAVAHDAKLARKRAREAYDLALAITENDRSDKATRLLIDATDAMLEVDRF